MEELTKNKTDIQDDILDIEGLLDDDIDGEVDEKEDDDIKSINEEIVSEHKKKDKIDEINRKYRELLYKIEKSEREHSNMKALVEELMSILCEKYSFIEKNQEFIDTIKNLNDDDEIIEKLINKDRNFSYREEYAFYGKLVLKYLDAKTDCISMIFEEESIVYIDKSINLLKSILQIDDNIEGRKKLISLLEKKIKILEKMSHETNKYDENDARFLNETIYDSLKEIESIKKSRDYKLDDNIELTYISMGNICALISEDREHRILSSLYYKKAISIYNEKIDSIKKEIMELEDRINSDKSGEKKSKYGEMCRIELKEELRKYKKQYDKTREGLVNLYSLVEKFYFNNNVENVLIEERKSIAEDRKTLLKSMYEGDEYKSVMKSKFPNASFGRRLKKGISNMGFMDWVEVIIVIYIIYGLIHLMGV